jgi:predicted metalloprotease with PDZ domain
MAEMLGKEYIYCRKPNPAMISTGHFDEDAIREDLRTTLRAVGDGPLEFAMKDVHTLNDEPMRLGRWVDLAREVCAD